MYVVFAEELNGAPPGPANNARTLDEAFARICCRCGLSYRFSPTDEGWTLELTDVERPECSPEPILSQYKRLQDAQHDLMSQAVDGRVRGHVAISHEHFATTLIMRTVGGVRTLAG
jgi:hypothetical protein